MDNSTVFGGQLVFDHRSQEWSIFCSRFLQYCMASNLTSDTDKSGLKRKALLLTSFVEETYRIAKALVFPEELDCVEFETLYEKLSSHFLPKRNTFAERFNFYKAEQRPREQLAEWAARVHSLAQYCAFSSGLELETALRDRFVLGLNNIKEKEKLFDENIETLTFRNALEIAQTTHSARVALEATVPLVVRKRGTPRVRNKCEGCGRNHLTEKCYYRCSLCHQIGHDKRMCRKYKVQPRQNVYTHDPMVPLTNIDNPHNNIDKPQNNIDNSHNNIDNSHNKMDNPHNNINNTQMNIEIPHNNVDEGNSLVK